MTWITRSLGNPKRKVCCSKAAVSRNYKTKVIEKVGLGEGLLGINGARKRLWCVDMDLHTITNKLLYPSKT